MARPLRFQYPAAVYHVMARGDGGKSVFTDKEDHESFLHGLEWVCISDGWRVYAWVLMANHFHLLLETPEANLSSGMRVLLGNYSQARNSKQKRRAHCESEAERIISLVGAALVKAHSSMNNAWLAQRLCMGHPAAMSQSANRVRKDAKSRKILKMLEKIFKSKDSNPMTDHVQTPFTVFRRLCLLLSGTHSAGLRCFVSTESISGDDAQENDQYHS